MEWQPIETALDDEGVRAGEHVLLAGLLKHGRATIGFYYAPESVWYSWGHPRLPMEPGGTPTHWMPLPPAPPATA